MSLLAAIKGGCAWGAWPRTDAFFCEPDLCAWVVHPAETWSNLPYFLVGVWILLRAEGGRGPAWPLGALALVNGTISTLFHASMTVAWHRADVAMVLGVTAFLIVHHRWRAGLLSGHLRLPLWLLLGPIAGLSSLLHVRLTLALIALQLVWVARSVRHVTEPARRRRLRSSLIWVGLGLVFWLLDRSGVCVSGGLEHVVQPHVIWHILGAVALVPLFKAER